MEEVELEVKQAQAMPIGTLRLDLSFTFGKLHIAPALLQFAAQYPELNLNVSFSDRSIDLIEEGVDATVRIGMDTGLPIAVLYPQKRYLSAKVRVFVEFMTKLTTALKRVDIVD